MVRLVQSILEDLIFSRSLSSWENSIRGRLLIWESHYMVLKRVPEEGLFNIHNTDEALSLSARNTTFGK